MGTLYIAGWDMTKMNQSLSATFTLGGYSNIDLSLANIQGYDANGSNLYSHLDFHSMVTYGGSTPMSSTWADASFASILQEFLRAIATVFSWPSPTSFTVSFSDTTGKYTISYASNFGITFGNTTTRKLFGFSGNQSGSTSYTSNYICTYCILSTLPSLSRVSDEYEPNNVASLAISDGGYTVGMSRSVPIKFFDWYQEFETQYNTFSRKALTAASWVYQSLFEHCRTIYPFAIATSDFLTGYYPVCILRADGSNFRPERDMPDYDGHWHIPFNSYLFGWIPYA